MSPRLRSLKSKLHTLFCDADDALCTFRYFSHLEHTGCIRKISVKNSGYINIDDISLFQNDILIRNAVTNLIINRSTHALRESLIIERSRDTTVFFCETIYDVINLLCAHSNVDLSCYFIQDRCIKLSTFPDLFNLEWSF